MSPLILTALACIAATIAITVFAARAGSSEGQSFRESISEAWTNVAIGFGINYVANLLVLPLAGLPVTPSGAFWSGCIFTGISVVRSFLIRRHYNWRMVRSQPALRADYKPQPITPKAAARAHAARLRHLK